MKYKIKEIIPAHSELVNGSIVHRDDIEYSAELIADTPEDAVETYFQNQETLFPFTNFLVTDTFGNVFRFKLGVIHESN